MLFAGVTRPFTEKNQAGGCRLQLVPVEEVDVMPEEVRGTIADAIPLIADAVWRTVEPTRFTQEFHDEWQDVGGDQASVARLRCVLPKDRVALLFPLWELKPLRYVVLHHDMNGTMKVMGTKDEPAMIRVLGPYHGSDPLRDRNQYEVEVTVSRALPCPFYLQDPPDILVPGAACETLGELIDAATWADIEAELSVGQLSDAEASICPVPVLCDVIDDAVMAAGTDVIVAGAGTTDANGTYEPNGTLNGKNQYIKSGGIEEIFWTGTEWWIGTASGIYKSTDAVLEPWLVTTWLVGTATLPVPTVTNDVAGGAALLPCLSPDVQEDLRLALSVGVDVNREDAAGTPVLYSTVADGGSYTDARVAIRNSANSTDLEFIAGGVTQYVLKQVRVQYTDNANATQLYTPNITGITSGRYSTDLGVIPRIRVYKADGTTVIGYTDIAIAFYNVADSVITKPDATTVNLPATNALDVRNYRSGIVYRRGLDALWSGEYTSYGTGSEGANAAAGVYDYTEPVYPTHFAKLDRSVAGRWDTLVDNNIHADKERFTDETGAQTYTNNLVVDHLTGLMWYRVAASAATWATALSNVDGSSQGSYTDWRLPTEDELKSIINNEELGDPVNYAPFSLAVDLWTCTTVPSPTTSAKRMATSNGNFTSLAKTSTAQYIMVRTHLG